MKISVTVMAHPKRRAQANALLAQLTAYPLIQAYITWDEDNTEWHTGVRALRRGIGLADWHLVIQDDAILTPAFYDNISAAIAAVPVKSVISLYTGKVKPLADRVTAAVNRTEYCSWLSFNMLLWGVAVLIPSDHIEPMLEFVDVPMYDNTQYDSRIGIFYQRNMLPIYYTMPSLVDHDDALGTLLPDHATQQPRVAHKLSTGLVAWNDAVIDI